MITDIYHLSSVPFSTPKFKFYFLIVALFSGANLFPLAPCKSILNAFVYEIYQRVFVLFELSIKHTLSDFLLPFRCQENANVLIF